MARNVKVVVNNKAVLREVVSSGKRALSLKMRKAIDPKIQDKQKNLLKDFDTHPVTAEIKAGPNASNSSGLTGGYGNLFSFIGFDSNSNPTAAIREILDRKIVYKVKALNVSGKFEISITVPSLEEIFSVSPIPWADGLSWVQGIEKGISNIGSYVYSNKELVGSRSGSGLQVKKGVGNQFKTTPYISKIIKDFKNSLKKL